MCTIAFRLHWSDACISRSRSKVNFGKQWPQSVPLCMCGRQLAYVRGAITNRGQQQSTARPAAVDHKMCSRQHSPHKSSYWRRWYLRGLVSSLVVLVAPHHPVPHHDVLPVVAHRYAMVRIVRTHVKDRDGHPWEPKAKIETCVVQGS